MIVCRHCAEAISIDRVMAGWRHKNGGGSYMQRCVACGFQESKSPPAIRCPNCGSERGWRDDHVAEPDWSRPEQMERG